MTIFYVTDLMTNECKSFPRLDSASIYFFQICGAAVLEMYVDNKLVNTVRKYT